jgi:hypothetical protein
MAATVTAGRRPAHPEAALPRRLAEIGELDLDDPEARFAALVQLRLIADRR